MNRRSYGYLVRALNEFASLAARCVSKDLHHPVPANIPIRIDGLSTVVLLLGPNHASRDAERAAFALSKKITMTMCNAEKTKAVRAAILPAVCWRASWHLCFSLGNPISKFDNQGSEMSIRLLQIEV